MAHNFPVPDEAQLERLLVSVYKRMPDAEITRLNRIEDRLARNLAASKSRHKVNTIPWWIVLLLTGGIAAATWWMGNRYNDAIKVNDNDVTNIRDKDLPQATAPGHPESPQEQASDIERAESDRKESPIIYQREP